MKSANSLSRVSSAAALFATCAALSACGGGTRPPNTATTAAADATATAQGLNTNPPAANPAPAPIASAATRTAVEAYGQLSATTEAVVGKFAFAVLNMYPSQGVSAMQGQIDALRAVNPNIKLAQYVVLNEMNSTAAGDTAPVTNAIDAANWWVRYADGGLVQWTSAYGNDEVNVTDWAPTNSAGQRYPQWKASFDTNSVLHPLAGLNYIFNDNVMFQPRYDADIERIGTNQSRNDPTVMSHFRQGYASYWTALRSLNPSLKIIGNTDNDLSYAEYKGQLEGAFNECLMGQSWSIETWGGWDQMMARYRATLANTAAPHDVIVQACAASANPAQARYGFASVLLDNGYFAYSVAGATVPYWADEFSAPLGTPIEAPPSTATPSGVWLRHYSNGIVLVNPTTATLSLPIGPGYKHITGTNDPVVNNGLAESSVTLPPKSGLIMVKA